jgi:hypothetical protein
MEDNQKLAGHIGSICKQFGLTTTYWMANTAEKQFLINRNHSVPDPLIF